MRGALRLEYMSGYDDDAPGFHETLIPDGEHAAAPSAQPPAIDQTQGNDDMVRRAAMIDETPPVIADEDDHEEAPVVLPPVDVSQFEAIYDRFNTPIINYLYRLVGNREQAYDLAQDAFVKVFRALNGGTTIQPGALSSWLYRIASNTATDALRRRRLIAWLPLSLFNEDRGVGAGMPTGENDDGAASGQAAFGPGLGYDGARFEQNVADREAVQHVLEKLPPKYATCLLLYEYEGFSCAEIAQMLEISASAVKMRLMRAREKFITLYQQEVAGS